MLSETSPFNRFLLGVLAPFLLEGLIYQSYLFLNPKLEPNFNFFIIYFPLLFPLFFFFFTTPWIIYYFSGAGKNYLLGLVKNIDSIFLQEKEILSEDERVAIEEELKTSLIPELVRQYRTRYIDSYFQDRSTQTPISYNNLLSFYESLCIFGLLTGILNLFNALLTLYVHTASLDLAINIHIKQITDLINILIFFGLFLIIAISSFLLALISKNRISYLIPHVIPGFVQYRTPERIQVKELTVRSLAAFDVSHLVGDLSHDTGFLLNLYNRLDFYEQIAEIINEEAQVQAGKELVWDRYELLLEKKGISAKKIATLESSFLSSPVIKSAEFFSFDYREFESLKSDLSYTYQRIDNWEKLGNEEQLTAFMLLYRAAEALFRGILRKKQGKIGNFGTMVLSLAELHLVNNDEQIILNQVRRQRNFILHRSGEELSLSKTFMKNFYSTISIIITRAGSNSTQSTEYDED